MTASADQTHRNLATDGAMDRKKALTSLPLAPRAIIGADARDSGAVQDDMDSHTSHMLSYLPISTP